MMVELGERIYFAAGSDKNIKLTTKEDLELFKAYLNFNKKFECQEKGKARNDISF